MKKVEYKEMLYKAFHIFDEVIFDEDLYTVIDTEKLMELCIYFLSIEKDENYHTVPNHILYWLEKHDVQERLELVEQAKTCAEHATTYNNYEDFATSVKRIVYSHKLDIGDIEEKDLILCYNKLSVKETIEYLLGHSFEKEYNNLKKERGNLQ